MSKPSRFVSLAVQPLEDRTTPSAALQALDYDPSRVAFADVNGDGTSDVISVTKAGTVTKLTVQYAGMDVTAATTSVFESTYTGGARVAAGDLDGAGRAEIVVTADAGGSGRVVVLKVFADPTVNVTSATRFTVFTQFQTVASFFGIEDKNFRGGSSVAVADLNTDGYADVFIAAGVGGGPRVAVYEGTSLVGVNAPVPTTTVDLHGSVTADTIITAPQVVPAQFFDNQGVLRNFTIGFTRTTPNTYTLSAAIPGATVTVSPTVVSFNTNGSLAGPASATLTFTGLPGGTQTLTLNLGTPGAVDGVSLTMNTASASTRFLDGRLGTSGVPTRLVNDFFALPADSLAFRGGISIDAGDLNADGTPDLIVGAGPGGGQRTRVISGTDILANKGSTATQLADFLLGGADNGNRLGVIVSFEPSVNGGTVNSFAVYPSFVEASTGKTLIAGGTFYLGKNLPKAVGQVPELDDRVIVQ